jgi:Icc protein
VIVIAHLSDPHLDASARSNERAERVMRYLEAAPVPADAIVVTGDITDHGKPEEYEAAARIFVSSVPVLLVPGNCDSRTSFRAGLLNQPASEAPINRIVSTERADYLLLDSSIPKRHDGHLDDTTLAWADTALGSSNERPAFLAFHHPPVEVHAHQVDRIRQFEEHRLAALMERHPRIAAVMVGHAHTPCITTFAGRPLLVGPGIDSTLVLPWEHGDDDVSPDAPPALAFHLLDEGGRITTHIRFVP